MALKDILTNAKYGDDIVLTLPDGTTASLGEMRALEANERKALLGRQQSLEQAEAGIMQRITSLRQAGLLDENLNPVVPSQTSIKQHVTQATGLTEDDPLFGDVVKAMKAELATVRSEAQKEIDAMKAQMGQLAGVTKQAVSGYLNDFYGTTFAKESSALPEDIRKDLKLESAIEYATQHNLMDKMGRLDIASAVDRMTWEDRKKLEMSKVQAESKKVQENREALAQMQRPGGQRSAKPVEGQFNPMNEKGQPKSFEDAIAAAAQDDELWSSALKYVQ